MAVTRRKPGEGAVPADRTDARRRPGTGQRNGWCAESRPAVEVGHRGADQRLFEGRALALGVARRTVPGGRDHKLIVGDLAVVDLDPVRQCAARSFSEADALGIHWPALRFPALAVEGGDFVDLHALHQLAEELLEPDHGQRRIQAARRGAAQRGEERGNRHVELAQRVP